MKFKKIVIFTMGCVLLTCQPALSVMKPSGMDNKLEWGVVREFNLASPPVDIAQSLDGKYAFVLTTNSEVLVYDDTGKLQGTIPVDKGVTSIDIGPRAQYLHLSDREEKKLYTLSIDFVVNIQSDNSPTKGKANAPVTIAVFSDFQ